MKRLGIQSRVCIGLIVFGAFWLLFAFVRLGGWAGYKRAHSVIGVAYEAYKDHGEIRYDTNRIRMIGANPELTVGFMRSSGSRGSVVQPERFLPANAKPGDNVTVLYREENGRDADAAVVYSFDAVWREPLRAALVGAFCICIGLWFRRRQGYWFGARHEKAV